jgi:hypothetical protein
MSSFELPVSKIRVELSYFDICPFAFLERSWIYSVQNCLEEFIAEFLNVIVDRKTFKDNLSRCVKLFRETGGVYRRKTTGQPLKRTAAVIETAREIMQNAPHTSISTSVLIN